LKRLPDESMADEIMVVSLWKHEMNRIVRDRIARSSDLNWFDEIMEKTITTVDILLLTILLETFLKN
jgi:hypothetical protein